LGIFAFLTILGSGWGYSFTGKYYLLKKVVFQPKLPQAFLS
jgi:hypothetical protein